MPRKRIDPDSPPMTDEFLKGFRPVREAAPELIIAQEERKRSPGRPKAETTKEAVKLRLSPSVISFFRQGGRGWQTRINVALEDFVAREARRAAKRAAK
jgi:uncharacterized protein (DUF4415 family)